MFLLVGAWACLYFVYFSSERTRNVWSGLLKMQLVHSSCPSVYSLFKKVKSLWVTLVCRGHTAHFVNIVLTFSHSTVIYWLPTVWKLGAVGQEVGKGIHIYWAMCVQALWPFVHTVLSLFSHVQLFVTPWTMGCQTPLSMGILQARRLEWVATPSSRGSFQPRGKTHKLFNLPKKYQSLYSQVSVWQVDLFFQARYSCPCIALHGEGSWGRVQAWWESMARSMNNDCCVRGESGDTNAM